PLGAPCQRDYDCPNSACDEATGECLPACPSDPEAPLCDALPPVCPIGSTLVATAGCYGCHDPADACAPAAPETCWGAFQDPDGVCIGPNDGVLPAECCQTGHYRHQFGTLEPSCAPDDGPAVSLGFSLGHRACGDQPRANLRVFVWADRERLRGESFGLAGGQSGGQAQFCDLDDCDVATAGEIHFDAISDYELTGRYWIRLGQGVQEATFRVESCGELPHPGCG
ncbi:MAG: hypothetical protein KC613_22305, partial [Myxococcales bacterium]|nr:hypothetical protein [Myxococcales bacterium]